MEERKLLSFLWNKSKCYFLKNTKSVFGPLTHHRVNSHIFPDILAFITTFSEFLIRNWQINLLNKFYMFCDNLLADFNILKFLFKSSDVISFLKIIRKKRCTPLAFYLTFWHLKRYVPVLYVIFLYVYVWVHCVFLSKYIGIFFSFNLSDQLPSHS